MRREYTQSERLYFSLQRERDELRYQVELYRGFIDKKNARLAEIDRQLAEMEAPSDV